MPSLPPLYFIDHATTTTAAGKLFINEEAKETNADDVTSAITTRRTTWSSSSSSSSLVIPPEVLQQCLTQYADWGDLAKLACVQKNWSNIMLDAASVKNNKKKNDGSSSLSSSTATTTILDTEEAWELSQSLLNGTHGLCTNRDRGMNVLRQLSGIDVDPITHMPLKALDDDDDMNKNANRDKDEKINHKKQNYYAPAMKELARCYFEGVATTTTTLTTTTTGACGDDSNNDDVDTNDKDDDVSNGPSATSAADVGLAWLHIAYEIGHDPDAAYQVATIYEYGKYGIAVDVIAAFSWFQTAANAGHIEAMTELALCYELGCGTEQSDELALDWYMKAANLGHCEAKYSVGEAFEEARGVPQSDEEACLWYYKAALEGDEDSRQALRRLSDIARIIIPGVSRLLLEA